MSEINFNKPIVLVGMMGCGKSYIGKALANEFGLPFYDSDSLLEKQQGKSITQIFADDGEAHFRVLEKEVISDLLDRGLCVIATGGGALTTAETLSKVKSAGVSIWLNSDIDTIYERVKDDKTRPLLDCENPKAKLEDLLLAREELYDQADIEIDNSAGAQAVINDINERLTPFFNIKHSVEEFTP